MQIQPKTVIPLVCASCELFSLLNPVPRGLSPFCHKYNASVSTFNPCCAWRLHASTRDVAQEIAKAQKQLSDAYNQAYRRRKDPNKRTVPKLQIDLLDQKDVDK